MLGVSTATIERAYEQLTAEGYVKSKPKIGWFAAGVEAGFPAVPDHFHQSMQQVLHEHNAPAIDFHQGNVDHIHFPFNAWRKSTAKVWSATPDRSTPLAIHKENLNSGT